MKSAVSELLLVGLFLGASTLVEAQEWPRFRGPNGTGQAKSSADFKHLSDNNLAWKVELPGAGHSSPVGGKDRIYLTSTDGESGQFHVLAFDTSNGKSLWSHEFTYQTFPKHQFNSYASGTPAVDDTNLYVSWGTPDHYFLAGLTHEGELLWKRDLGTFESQHGPGTSPMLFEDVVIVTNEQIGKSFIIAVDKQTGETRWQTPRNSSKTAYSTPSLSKDPAGNPVLLVNSQAHGIGALDPRTGSPLWEYTNAFDKRSCSSPITASGLVFGSCGSGGGGNFVVAIRPPNGTSRKTPELAYEIRRSAPYVPCFITSNEWLFLWNDGGRLSCVEPATGKVQWTERTNGRFFGSPIAVGDQLIAVDDRGNIHVVASTGQFEQFGTYALEEQSHSTPAVIGDHLFVRTISHLWKFKPNAE